MDVNGRDGSRKQKLSVGTVDNSVCTPQDEMTGSCNVNKGSGRAVRRWPNHFTGSHQRGTGNQLPLLLKRSPGSYSTTYMYLTLTIEIASPLS